MPAQCDLSPPLLLERSLADLPSMLNSPLYCKSTFVFAAYVGTYGHFVILSLSLAVSIERGANGLAISDPPVAQQLEDNRVAS